ncbi:putative fatty-acid amide hydrolase [Microdochium bolleyi]|uniref:Putative fatty-acid amide hydrolase n=1 Tax=Microdochium bolleyi TaxID=196109 RepID=A0A136IKE0_9PEZI|nr:putative fatty-acid amide hydrolase [Microdochium bolleyi]
MESSLKPYEAIAAQKKAEQWSRIPEHWRIPADRLPGPGLLNVMDVPLTCGVLDEVEIAITSDFDATALLEELKNGRLSAEQVSVAFCKRAAVAHHLTNCLTEIFFTTAIARAKHLDTDRRLNPQKPLPPLFGLPVSLKDSFAVEGHDTTTGLACFAGQPAGSPPAALARMLLDLGAVLYCKTNLPQSILTGDSHNHVFGRTLNPRSCTDCPAGLTAGGSTGGEGALLALRGSVLGVGTDVAGSIRVPAVCNGVYGFRASVGVVPHGGVRDLQPEGLMVGSIVSTAGPMATSLRDIEMFMRVVMQAGGWRWDPTAVCVPWIGGGRGKKLRIGVALDDGLFTPTPPVRRGLQMVVDKLVQHPEDVEVIPIILPEVGVVYGEVIKYLTLCGGQHYLDLFARTGEPAIPSLANTGVLSIPTTTETSVLWAMNATRAEISAAYHRLFVTTNDLDAILMPPAPHTAVPHDAWSRPAYTCIWNYVDYPALVMPVDKVRVGVDEADDVGNAKYGQADEEMYKLYTGPEAYEDAPICVQLVGYKQRDEALLRVAAVVEGIVNKAD